MGEKLNNVMTKRIDARNFVDELEGIALVLPNLKILLGMAVHGHTNRERFGECLRILDGRFISEHIRARA